jgi:hypothetical protein
VKGHVVSVTRIVGLNTTGLTTPTLISVFVVVVGDRHACPGWLDHAKIFGQVHRSVEGDLGRLADGGSVCGAHMTHVGFGSIQMTQVTTRSLVEQRGESFKKTGYGCGDYVHPFSVWKRSRMEEDVDVALGHAGIIAVETIAHSEVDLPQEMKGGFADREHSM